MSAKRITIGRTFSQTPLQTEDASDGHSQTFILSTGKRALFTLEHITAKEIEEKTYVVMETNGRDQSGLTPESLRDIIRTIKLQQFFPAIGVKHGDRIEILDGSRRRAAALTAKPGWMCWSLRLPSPPMKHVVWRRIFKPRANIICVK